MGLSNADVAAMYRRQGRQVPPEFAGKEEIRAKVSKMRNEKKVVNGITFDSALEATAYQVLRQWELAGAIEDLRMQPAFTLQERFKDAQGRTVNMMTYSADFRFYDRVAKRVRHIDAKGHITQAFLKSMKQMKDKFPDVEIELWNRDKIKELSRA